MGDIGTVFPGETAAVHHHLRCRQQLRERAQAHAFGSRLVDDEFIADAVAQWALALNRFDGYSNGARNSLRYGFFLAVFVLNPATKDHIR